MGLKNNSLFPLSLAIWVRTSPLTPAPDQPARFRSVTENTGTPIVEKVTEIKYYKYVLIKMYGFLNIKSIFLFPHFLFLFSYKLLGENTFLIFLDPNTRQRKHKFTQKITETVNFLNLSVDDQVDVLTLTLKQLNILDRFKFLRKPTRKGCSLLPRATRVAVWEFWHEHCFESTNTTQLAKLRVTD